LRTFVEFFSGSCDIQPRQWRGNVDQVGSHFDVFIEEKSLGRCGWMDVVLVRGKQKGKSFTSVPFESNEAG
jgi:hypothetical protein